MVRPVNGNNFVDAVMPLPSQVKSPPTYGIMKGIFNKISALGKATSSACVIPRASIAPQLQSQISLSPAVQSQLSIIITGDSSQNKSVPQAVGRKELSTISPQVNAELSQEYTAWIQVKNEEILKLPNYQLVDKWYEEEAVKPLLKDLFDAIKNFNSALGDKQVDVTTMFEKLDEKVGSITQSMQFKEPCEEIDKENISRNVRNIMLSDPLLIKEMYVNFCFVTKQASALKSASEEKRKDLKRDLCNAALCFLYYKSSCFQNNQQVSKNNQNIFDFIKYLSSQFDMVVKNLGDSDIMKMISICKWMKRANLPEEDYNSSVLHSVPDDFIDICQMMKHMGDRRGTWASECYIERYNSCIKRIVLCLENQSKEEILSLPRLSFAAQGELTSDKIDHMAGQLNIQVKPFRSVPEAICPKYLSTIADSRCKTTLDCSVGHYDGEFCKAFERLGLQSIDKNKYIDSKTKKEFVQKFLTEYVKDPKVYFTFHDEGHLSNNLLNGRVTIDFSDEKGVSLQMLMQEICCTAYSQKESDAYRILSLTIAQIRDAKFD